MSIPRRLGRLARGFVSNTPDDRLRSDLDDGLRSARGRSEVLKDALEAAWHSAYEEWRRGEEERKAEEARLREEEAKRARNYGPENPHSTSGTSRPRDFSPPFTGRKYSPEVLRAYERLDLVPGVPLSEVDARRRAMIKKFHPDRFTDPDKRMRAERVTADINSAHDTIERNLLGKK